MKTRSHAAIDLTHEDFDLHQEPSSLLRGSDSSGAVDAPPIDVALTLLKTRRRKRISLDRAAAETKISKQYLQALEQRAPIERFPAPVYARFFLNDYTRYLGLEQQPLADAFAAQTERASEPLIQPLPQPVSKRRRWTSGILVAVSAVALLGLGVRHFTATGPRPALHPSAGPGGQAPDRMGAPPAAGNDRTQPVRLRAVLRTSATCWVKATADGRALMANTVGPGRSLTLQARRTLVLVLGNGGGVRLVVNGKPIATGGAGRVIRLSFALRGGRVVTG